jgi:predicted component of type VI protein secretion system
VADPELPPFPSSSGGLWHARSPRIPFVEPLPPPDRSYVLDFSTGQTVAITGSGIIGRAPHDAADDPTLQRVSVDDPGRSVSKVHARFEIDSDGLWIEDRNSGNGTALVRPGEPAVAITPGHRHPVARGDVVRIGRQSFTVR